MTTIGGGGDNEIPIGDDLPRKDVELLIIIHLMHPHRIAF
jgi:hypothetical protein